MTIEEQSMINECWNGFDDELTSMQRDQQISPYHEDNALAWDYF